MFLLSSNEYGTYVGIEVVVLIFELLTYHGWGCHLQMGMQLHELHSREFLVRVMSLNFIYIFFVSK